MFTFNVGCSSQLELAIEMSASIEDCIECYSAGSGCGINFINYDKLPSILFIPSIWYNCKVVMLEYEALSECQQITDVTISEGITVISSCVFKNCHNLLSVQIPDSVIEIDGDNFNGCEKAIVIFAEGTYTVNIGTALYNFVALINYKSAKLYFSTNISSSTTPIYSNQNIYTKSKIFTGTKSLSELGELSTMFKSYSQLIDAILNKKSSSENKNIPTCQKSKSPLNLLLLTQMTIKN